METFKEVILEKDWKDSKGVKQVKSGLGFSEKENRWYAWSHRAYCSFGIGDKLFDQSWTPDGSKPGLDNPITDKLKFTERGSVTIKTLEQAKQAATNFSKYVS